MVEISDYMPLLNLPTVNPTEVELIREKEQHVPGSVNFTLKRFRKLPGWEVEDTGMLVYNFSGKNGNGNCLELRFCLNGNMYCNNETAACDQCKFKPAKSCSEKIDSIDVVSLSFPPDFLQ